jgi:hypothetical protein
MSQLRNQQTLEWCRKLKEYIKMTAMHQLVANVHSPPTSAAVDKFPQQQVKSRGIYIAARSSENVSRELHFVHLRMVYVLVYTRMPQLAFALWSSALLPFV